MFSSSAMICCNGCSFVLSFLVSFFGIAVDVCCSTLRYCFVAVVFRFVQSAPCLVSYRDLAQGPPGFQRERGDSEDILNVCI